MPKVDVKHPARIDREEEYQLMRHVQRGETEVKKQDELYLPMPSAFRLQADKGTASYTAYQTRAEFPDDLLPPTIRGMVGLIHSQEAKIEGLEGSGIEDIWERATKDGLPLEAFHRRVTGELLLNGRYGILVDAPSADAGGDDLPFFAGYTAETIINWSEERDFFVLDESGKERQGFEWKEVKRFRELRLRGQVYSQQVYNEAGEGVGQEVVPMGRGRANKPLEEIPFVVVGTRDLSTAPEDPPLIGVARAAIAVYQLSADYRHQLYMTGQETLVIINAKAPEAVGPGLAWELIAPEGRDTLTPDAKYIGPKGVGIDAHAKAIAAKREDAARAGAALFDTDKAPQESGEAKKIRYGAQTATLTSIAQASAAALEKALRYAARMRGASEEQAEKIVVKPNLRFLAQKLTPQEAVELMKLWQGGILAKETVYDNLQEGGIANPERSYEDEEEKIEEQGPALGTLAPPGSDAVTGGGADPTEPGNDPKAGTGATTTPVKPAFGAGPRAPVPAKA